MSTGDFAFGKSCEFALGLLDREGGVSGQEQSKLIL
jgi:hypothetical protein